MGFNVIDQVIVGLLGADAVAAVGLSNSIASIALLMYASRAWALESWCPAHAPDHHQRRGGAEHGTGFCAGPRIWSRPFFRRRGGRLGHPAFAKRSVLGVDPVSLRQQKRRALGLATAGFKNRCHGGQAPALDRADRAFRGALGHEHLHLSGGVHPPGHHDTGG